MQEKLEKSMAAYEDAFALGVHNRRAVAELGSIYDVGGHYQKAIALYETHLQKSPSDTDLRHQLGLTYLLVGKADLAIPHLKTAAQQKPASLQIATDLGYAHWQAGQLEKAENILSQVIAKKPHAIPQQFLFQVKIARGKTAEALHAMGAYLQKKPRTAEIRKIRARLHSRLGKYQEALEDASFLFQSKKQDPSLLVVEVGSLIHLNKIQEASERLEVAKSRLPNRPEWRFRGAQIAWRQGDAKALPLLEEYAEQHPQVREVLEELALAAKTLKRKKTLRKARRMLKSLERN